MPKDLTVEENFNQLRDQMVQEGYTPSESFSALDKIRTKQLGVTRATKATEMGIDVAGAPFKAGVDLPTIKAMPTPKSEEVMKRERTYETLKSDLGLFEKNLEEVELRGPAFGKLPPIGAIFPESADFEAYKDMLAYSMASAIGEQKGQGASDKDIKIFKEALPKRSDTAKVAKNKIANIEGMLASRMGEAAEEVPGGLPPTPPAFIGPTRPTEGLPDVPPTTPGEMTMGDVGFAARGAMGTAFKPATDVAKFFFPDTSQLIGDVISGYMPKKPTTKEIALGPIGVATREDQLGKAARELGLTVILDFFTLKALSFAKPVATAIFSKVPGSSAVKKAFTRFSKMAIPEQTFLSNFTIPTKLAKRLKPFKTAAEVLLHGVGGSLDDMTEMVGKVTGADGIITKLTHKVLATLPDEVAYDEVLKAAKNQLTTETLIDEKTAKATITKINQIIRPGKQVSKVSALDAFDTIQILETKGYELIHSSTYLTGRIENEQLGRAYLVAADAIKDNINILAKKSKVIDIVKLPQVLAEIRNISPRLADQVSKVRNLSELRSVAAPFVRLGQMVDLTKWASLSAFNKLSGQMGRGAGARVAGTAAGTMLGGVPGAVGGYLAGEVLGPMAAGVSQAIGTPIRTGVARGLKAIPGKVLPPIEKLIVGGARIGAQTGRAALQRR